MAGEEHSPFEPFLPPIEAVLARFGFVDVQGDGDVTAFVGVSGGADSVFLLHVLSRIPSLRKRLTVLHFNHGTRGPDNDEDAAFVAELCRSLSIPFVSGGPPKGNGNLSEAALRKARFSFFREHLSKSADGYLVLAHNKDDQVETILMNLFRGTGPRGLLGIHEKSGGRIVRPLLSIPGETIRTTLEAAGIPYRQDASNLDERYLRNRVRRSLIPLVRTLFPPRGDHHLADTAELLKREFRTNPDPGWTGRIADLITPELMVFPLSRYRKLPPSLQPLFLRELLEAPALAGLPVPEERNLLRSLAFDPVHEGPMGKGWHIRIEFSKVHLVYRLSPLHSPRDTWTEPIDAPLIRRLKAHGDSVSIAIPAGGSLRLWWEREAGSWTPWERGHLPSRQCLIDVGSEEDSPGAPLMIGMVRPGADRILRSKDRRPVSLSRLAKKAGLPRSFRDGLPAIRHGSGILWVPYTVPIREHENARPALPDEGLAVLFEERRDGSWKKSSGNP
jgi:tRNA(Ile)-lysidine synthase